MTKKRNHATEQQKIEMAKDCLFSSATIPQLEAKWGVTYMTIFRHTKTFDFKYFKKQNRKRKLKPALKTN